MKKGKPHVVGKDQYARVSFLFQAAHSSLVSPALTRAWGRNLDLVSKKTLSKLSPTLKRAYCKRCYSMLIPGIGVKIYIENASKSQDDHNDVLVHECSHCGTKKRFPVGKNRDYVLFAHKAES